MTDYTDPLSTRRSDEIWAVGQATPVYAGVPTLTDLQRVSTFAVAATPSATTPENPYLQLVLDDLAIGTSSSSQTAVAVSGEGPVSFNVEWRSSSVDPANPQSIQNDLLTTSLPGTSPLYSLEYAWFPKPTPEYPNEIARFPAEGDSGTANFSFDILRHGGIDQPGTVPWRIEPYSSQSVQADDFVGGLFPSGVASFAPGQDRVRVTFPVAGDRSYEWDENFIFIILVPETELFHSVGALFGFIDNDDTAPIIALAPLAIEWTEGDADGFTFTVERYGSIDQVSVIDWWLYGAGARPANGTDFAGGELPFGTVTLTPGQATATVQIATAADNTVAGPDRSFHIIARPNEDFVRDTPPQFSGAPAWGTIHDNDGPPDGAEITAASGPLAVAPTWYAGPVGGLEKEIILLDRGDLTLAATTPNWFIHTGSGNDAVAAAGGTNVLDGGTGSNFLSGRGEDTFFVDARGLAAPVWSTVLDLQVGDAVNIWVDAHLNTTLIWEDNQGAEGYRGLTLHVAQPGRPFASLTLPGFTRADADTWPELRHLRHFQGYGAAGEYYIGLSVNPYV